MHQDTQNRAAVAYLIEMPAIRQWPAVQQLLQQAADGTGGHWQLAAISAKLVQASAPRSTAAMAAIAAAHISIVLVDDMLDDDPRGLFRRIGGPTTANMAAALQAASLQAIAHSDAPSAQQRDCLSVLSEMFATTALGQSWDLLNPADETAYWRLVAAKSGPFFGMALQIGALLQGAASEITAGLRVIGELYGEIVQIQDDLHDVMERPASPDWLLMRSSLPLLFAQIVPHPERDRFMWLRRQAAEPAALQEAQEILLRCGALSYCVDQVLQRHRCALDILEQLPLADHGPLVTVLSSAVDPLLAIMAHADALVG